MAEAKDRLDKFVSLGSLVIATIALVVSIYALQLQRKDFQSSLAPVLTASTVVPNPTTVDELSTIRFSSTDSGVNVQRLKVVFPSDFTSEEKMVDPPDLIGSFTVELYDMPSILSRYVPRQPPENYFWACEDSVPVVLETEFTAKGLRLVDKSIYDMNFIYLVQEGGRPYGEGLPQIKNFTFVRRLRATENSRSVVDSVFKGKRFVFR